MTLVSMSIPTRNRPKSLDRTLKSIENTIVNHADVEVILHLDDDDRDSISYIENTTFAFQVKYQIFPRDPRGYKMLALWHAELLMPTQSEFVIFFADDVVPLTYGWDEMLKPYIGKFGIVTTSDDEGAEYPIECFITKSLKEVMYWFGSHPYIDRWIDSLVQGTPRLALGKINAMFSHIKDNPPSQQNIDPRSTDALHPALTPDEFEEWVGIYERVRIYLGEHT